MSEADPGQPMQAAPPTRREHGQALLLALICAVLFLRESLLPGRALVPYPPELFDVIQAEALDAGTFAPEHAFRGNVGMGDKYLQSLCWDRVMQDRLRSGELPRWTRDIGGGAPFVPQMAQPYQPINLLLFVLPSEQWYGWWFLIHQVLFGWFAYQFLRRIGCAHAAALLGLVAAALGLWTQCKLHHNVILTAALSLWPMLIATHDLVARGVTHGARRLAVGWLALWAGLSWSSGFVVVSLQATYLTIAYALFCAWRTHGGERWRRLLPVSAGLGLGAVLSLANMLPVLLAATESARAGTFDAARLQGLGLEWDHLWTACWPDLLSWSADRFYVRGPRFDFDTRMPWSQLVLLHPLRPEDQSAFQNWVETSFAIGVLPLAAATSALFDRRHRAHALLFAAIAFVAFGMATADQPFLLLARLLPGVASGDLRRLLFSVAMPLVVLTGLGADAWLRDTARTAGRSVCAAVASISALALVLLWYYRAEPDFVLAFARMFALDGDDPLVQQAGGDPTRIAAAAAARAAVGEVSHNHLMLTTTALRALLAAAIGLIALRQQRRWTLAICIVVTIAELVHTGLGPMQTVAAERITQVPRVLTPLVDPTLAEGANGVRPRLGRLVAPDARKDAALPGNIPGFLGIEDSSAYNPLPKARQEQFFAAIDPLCVYGGAGVGAFRDPSALRHPLLDLFGVRFVLSRLALPDGLRLTDVAPSGTGGFHLYHRPSTLPRATFVREIDVLADVDARLQVLGRVDRDVARRMILEDASAPRPSPAAFPVAKVDITRHQDERVQLTVRCSHDGYVRLADPYDAGWRATVDGEPTKVYVADHYLRAVYVEAGEHEIVFTYDAARVVWPLRLSLLAWLAVGWLLVTGRRRR